MLFKNFDEFYEAAMDLISIDPNRTRLTIKSIKRKSILRVIVTNNRKVSSR